MQPRFNPYEKGQGGIKHLFGMGGYLKKSSLGVALIDLINFRVSQINGCAYCLDMHAKDLRVLGESEQRLYVLDAWREAPFYTTRERAALAWAEAVTTMPNREVPDDVYNDAVREFSEEELTDLTLAVTTINTFNRINIAFRTPAGSYQPGQYDAVLK